MEFKHKSVLLDECIENLKIRKDCVYVDGTLGGGGHSYHILKALNGTGMLIGIDRDTDALKAIRKVEGADKMKTEDIIRAALKNL